MKQAANRVGQPDARGESREGESRAGRTPVPIVRASRTTASIQATLAAGMSYELGIDSFFGAAHAMRPGGERHTHSFRVQAAFVTDSIDENGMICGFREVSDLLDAEARRYSNRFLNEIEPFDSVQATGENLAAVIYRNLLTSLVEHMPDGPRLIGVTLWENPTSYVRVGMGGVP
jgi:6-pyruvoyltetrahydropterin/6-carboxytetrahydropterin synthase